MLESGSSILKQLEKTERLEGDTGTEGFATEKVMCVLDGAQKLR